MKSEDVISKGSKENCHGASEYLGPPFPGGRESRCLTE